MDNLKIYLDKDINTELIKSKKIAIIGFGSQGYGQSMNLKDSGCDVVLGLRLGGKSDVKAKDYGFKTMTIEDAVKTIKKGACDFLTKPVKDEVLIEAIESAVEACLKTIDEELHAEQETARLKQLTEREMQIALALSEGKLNKTIAYELGISERTVQVHRANILRKLNIRSMAELATMLVHAGMK